MNRNLAMKFIEAIEQGIIFVDNSKCAFKYAFLVILQPFRNLGQVFCTIFSQGIQMIKTQNCRRTCCHLLSALCLQAGHSPNTE